jgi:hypothetical protein
VGRRHVAAAGFDTVSDDRGMTRRRRAPHRRGANQNGCATESPGRPFPHVRRMALCGRDGKTRGIRLWIQWASTSRSTVPIRANDSLRGRCGLRPRGHPPSPDTLRLEIAPARNLESESERPFHPSVIDAHRVGDRSDGSCDGRRCRWLGRATLVPRKAVDVDTRPDLPMARAPRTDPLDKRTSAGQFSHTTKSVD